MVAHGAGFASSVCLAVVLTFMADANAIIGEAAVGATSSPMPVMMLILLAALSTSAIIIIALICAICVKAKQLQHRTTGQTLSSSSLSESGLTLTRIVNIIQASRR